MLAAHDAPVAQVEIVLSEDEVPAHATRHLEAGRVVGVLAPATVPDLPLDVLELEPVGEPEEYAQLLYARLRQADRLGIEVLLVVPPPERGVGIAVADRLRRAAAGRAS
jgi:L-threonylcarbamoyladenylate synthase